MKNARDAKCNTIKNVLNDLKESFGFNLSAIWGMSGLS